MLAIILKAYFVLLWSYWSKVRVIAGYCSLNNMDISHSTLYLVLHFISRIRAYETHAHRPNCSGYALSASYTSFCFSSECPSLLEVQNGYETQIFSLQGLILWWSIPCQAIKDWEVRWYYRGRMGLSPITPIQIWISTDIVTSAMMFFFSKILSIRRLIIQGTPS